MSFSAIPRHASLPRLDAAQPPEHTYYYVAYHARRGYHIESLSVSWQTPREWDAVLKAMARVAGREDFSCWLDSAAGDRFLEDHHWAPLLVDGVLDPAPPLLSQF